MSKYSVRKLCLSFMCAILLLLTLPESARAQLTRGSIAGTVRDPSGAVVAGAQVTVTQAGTNLTRNASTNEEGLYRVSALDPATYVVAITAPGFGTIENREVVVQTSLETTFDAELTVGGGAESVDVTAQAEGVTLNKTNPTLGLSVSTRQAIDLPISPGRDVEDLAYLSPNVFRAPGSSGISVNGQRARNNNFTIDGTDNNDVSITTSTSDIIPEAVQEFQIQTNAYSAEFGRNSGAQINIITRSGRNELFGDLFEYYRGSGLNARDNIEKEAGLTRPARFNRNQFGAVVGGPVFLPRFGEGGRTFYDGRNRTFFFFAFQADLLKSGAVLGDTIRIPTPAGFAALNAVPLRAATATVPAQTAASRQAALDRLSFLSGIYGQNPQFRNVRNVTVNGVGIETGQINSSVSQPSDVYSYITRLDHRIGEQDNLTFRYSLNDEVSPNLTGNLQFGDLFAAAQTTFDQNVQLSETHVFGPRVLNEFRASYVRRNLSFPENDPVSSTVQISGLFNVGGLANFPQGRIQNSYQFSDTATLLLGGHSVKLGADIRRIRFRNVSGFNTKGTFVFDNLQEFLNNNAATLTQALSTASYDAPQTQQFYFAQDDWKVTPELTLNLGLRYENATVPLGFFGATEERIRRARVPGPVRRDNNNFAPAVGFAYSPRVEGDGLLAKLFGDGETSIRGGYRVAYDLLFFNLLTVNAANFPFTQTSQLTNIVDIFPNRLPPSAVTFNPLSQFVNTPEDAGTPYAQLYSLTTQRELGGDYVLEFGYTGSRSINQINQLEANPAILTEAQAAEVIRTGNPNAIPSVQSRRLDAAIGSRALIATTAQATYNAGIVSLNKRLGNGGRLDDLQFGVSYTFSKLLSDNDESLGVAAITTFSPQVPQDFFNVRAERSLSAFDRPHRFVANYLYEVPTPGFARGNAFLRQVFGGFQLSGITERQSGQPFTIRVGVDANGNGSAGGDRPNLNLAGRLIPDPVTGNFRTFTNDNYFVVPRGANGLPLANSLPGGGNLGRNTFRGPGFYNTNLSVQKRFAIDERRRLIVRADFLNAFNQDDYGNPVVNLNNPDFGRNLNDFGQRTITLSGKFSF